MHWQTIPSLLLIIYYSTFTLATSSTLFCKCTCGSNSTLIQLPQVHALSPEESEVQLRRWTCADCNRSLCLEYDLPICKEVKESDVSATCFQRDSAKDQAVVYSFIAMTVGLLAYTAVKPCLKRRTENSTLERRDYNLVSSSQGNE